MTTATDRQGQAPRVTGTRALVVTMVAVDLVVVLMTGLAAVVSGGGAAVAALVGGLLTSVVIFGGTAMVNLVAGLVPSASLLVALMTYTLQLVLLVAVFLALSRSSLGDDATSRAWLAAAVIAAAVTWLVGHVVTASRARIPLYDLPARDRDASAGPGTEGRLPTSQAGGEA